MSDNEQIEDTEEYETTGSRVIPATVLLVALVGFISLGWYAYQAGNTSVKEEDLLLVEAEATPMKEAPLDPGGMQFPHQDKSIFETISGSNQGVDKSAEKLLSEAEQPVETLVQNVSATVPEIPKKPEVTEEVVSSNLNQSVQPDVPKAVIPSISSEETETPPETKPEEIVAEPEQKKPEPKVEQKAEKKAPVPSKTGNGNVQLGAFKSESEANSAWAKLSKNPAISGKKHNIQKADLGEKGVFYRLRVLGVDAKSTCAALAGKSPCMPVK